MSQESLGRIRFLVLLKVTQILSLYNRCLAKITLNFGFRQNSFFQSNPTKSLLYMGLRLFNP